MSKYSADNSLRTISEWSWNYVAILISLIRNLLFVSLTHYKSWVSNSQNKFKMSVSRQKTFYESAFIKLWKIPDCLLNSFKSGKVIK